MASGWNLWVYVWLQCIGVVSGCHCRRYIDILTIIDNVPYSTCISAFFSSSILLLCLFLHVFLFLFMLFLYNI